MLLLACHNCFRLNRQEQGKCPACGAHIGNSDIANSVQLLAYSNGYRFCAPDGSGQRTGFEEEEKTPELQAPIEPPKVWVVLVEQRYRWEGHENWQPDVTERVEISVAGVFDNQQAAHDFVRSQGCRYGVHYHVETYDLLSK